MNRIASIVLGACLIFPCAAWAAFGVDQDTEAFEGTFPPAGWSVTCTNAYSSPYGCWAQGTGYASGAGFAGNQVQAIYGDYLLDTSLISPAFSTVGYTDVNLVFDGYFYFYSGYGNVCYLQYSTNGGGTWTTFAVWATYGSVVTEVISLPHGALNQPSVMLRWRRTTSSYPYYYAALDNVRLESVVPVPATSHTGLAVLTLILSLAGVWACFRLQS